LKDLCHKCWTRAAPSSQKLTRKGKWGHWATHMYRCNRFGFYQTFWKSTSNENKSSYIFDFFIINSQYTLEGQPGNCQAIWALFDLRMDFVNLLGSEHLDSTVISTRDMSYPVRLFSPSSGLGVLAEVQAAAPIYI
jgi:hypothetical protein